MSRISEVFQSAVGRVIPGIDSGLSTTAEVESKLLSARAAYEAALQIPDDPSGVTHSERILSAAQANLAKAMQRAVSMGINPNATFETSTRLAIGNQSEPSDIDNPSQPSDL